MCCAIKLKHEIGIYFSVRQFLNSLGMFKLCTVDAKSSVYNISHVGPTIFITFL